MRRPPPSARRHRLDGQRDDRPRARDRCRAGRRGGADRRPGQRTRSSPRRWPAGSARSTTRSPAGSRPGCPGMRGRVSASRAAIDVEALEPPVVSRVARRGAGGAERHAWIAGGAVRDAALGREVTDLDLAVARRSRARRRRRSREAGEGHAFELSAEFATWRAVAGDGSWQVDADRAARRDDRGRPRRRATSRSAPSRCRLPAATRSIPTAASPTSTGGLLRVVSDAQLRRRPAAPAARAAPRRRAGARDRSRHPARSPARKPRARPSRPGSASWPSFASWSAAPTRCAEWRCSTSSA